MPKTKRPFELVGIFTAVREWRDGLPRRIEVAHGNSPVVLKVAKELRARFLEMEPGTEVRLSGVEKAFGNEGKRKVTGLHGDRNGMRNSKAEITIQICGKKNCWKRGGRELYEHLEERIAEEDLLHVHLERTSCLGNCQQCPSACLPAHDVLVGRANAGKLQRFLRAGMVPSGQNIRQG